MREDGLEIRGHYPLTSGGCLLHFAEDKKDAMVHYLKEDGIIQLQDNGIYSITNLGALLFAKDLNEFARLGR